MMKANIALIGIGLVVGGLSAWWWFSMWDECRLTNSFWYCMYVLSK